MLTASMVLLGGKNVKKKKKKRKKQKVSGEAHWSCCFPSAVRLPLQECALSVAMERETEILTVAGQSFMLAGWVYRPPSIVKGLNKSRPVETLRRELPSPQAFQASDRDTHKHSWPPSRRATLLGALEKTLQ